MCEYSPVCGIVLKTLETLEGGAWMEEEVRGGLSEVTHVPIPCSLPNTSIECLVASEIMAQNTFPP